MHGMLSALSLLIDTGLTEEQKELADIIDESGAILLQVINDILDYSKLSSGSFSINKEVMNIAEIVGAVRRCFNIGSSEGLRFEVDLDPHLPAFAQGDPLRYRQILQNLVSNAVKFTDKGYIRVKVAVTHEDEATFELKTEVIDSGIGVTPEAENVLFTPFTQLDNSSTKKFKGTGLGLSICKSLAELMGGNVGYMKNPLHQGSVFFFTTRINKLEATPIKPLAKASPDVELKKLAHTTHLLLVEDNAINQTIMVRLLRSFGFEKVDVAADGAEGLKMVTQKPLAYSLILMDISMPVMDGVTATRKIRAAGHSMPIVAMTANALKGDEEAYLAEGMNDYIAKPVDRRLLMESLLRLLG
jgi:osomolarity two-component system sensor histidine kinase TcsA